MSYIITEKKGIINSLKRKLVKKELYNFYVAFLYMPSCSPLKCKKCPLLEKKCISHLKRRSESIRWFSKHGYYIDDSKILSEIIFNKKYKFIGHKIKDILQDFLKNDFDLVLLLKHFDKNEKVYFNTTKYYDNYIDIMSYNNKKHKYMLSKKELTESIFILFSEDDTFSQEAFDV